MCIYELGGVVGATQGRIYATVFCKEQNDTECKNFVNLLCSYVNTFIFCTS